MISLLADEPTSGLDGGEIDLLDPLLDCAEV